MCRGNAWRYDAVYAAPMNWSTSKLAIVAMMFALAGCSSSTSKDATTATPAPTNDSTAVTDATTVISEPAMTTTMPRPAFRPDAVGQATVTGPITTGNSATVLGVPGLDLAQVGYVQEEFFLSGTATAYQSAAPLTSDGQWTVAPASTEPYTTRIVVRRPADASTFNGNVAVEWLNVTAGFDSPFEWTFAHTELIRAGWAWVGVSAQAVGILGGGSPLGAALALKAADPVRYAPLVHPGDSYSYDIYSQAGAVLRTQTAAVLGPLEPKRIISVGESQSAFRLSTYVNAVAPLANVYDGYLVHSRGAVGAPLSQDPQPVIKAPDPTLVRTDIGVPVLTFLTETDMVGKGLGYSRSQQPDTDMIRAWEVPGTAHADAYGLGLADFDDGSGVADAKLFKKISTPPNSIYGGVITCESPINTGPHTYVLRSAFAALAAWLTTGTAPPSMPRIELDDSHGLVVDASGNALGGIRTPQLDAPIAKLSGVGQTGPTFCGLFGTTTPFDAATLAAKYPSHDAFVAKWNSAVDSAVSSGALLPADAARLKTVAGASSIGTP